MIPNNDFPVHLFMLYKYLLTRIVWIFYANRSIDCVILQKYIILEGLKRKVYFKK